MKKLILTTMVTIITFGGPCVAAENLTVKDALNEISQLAGEEKDLESGFKQALSIKEELETQSAELDGEKDRLANEASRFSQDCITSVSQSEYPGRLASCKQREAVLNPQIEDYNDRLHLFQERTAKFAAAVQLMVDRDHEIEQRLQYLYGRLNSIEIFEACDCDKAESAEAAAYCLWRVWDAAGANDGVVADPPAGIQ